MKKLFLFCLCLLLSGCFEITEKIKHHKDQSGEYSLVVDFSNSWFKTKSAMLLEEVDGVSIPSEEEIKAKLAKFRSDANQVNGISMVMTTYDFKNYIFKISFHYDSVTALNKILNTIDKKNNFTHFKVTDFGFERIASYPLPKNLVQKEDKKEDLTKASITAVYSFDQEVSVMQNPNAKLSKTKKTVFLKQNIWSVLHNNKLMNNTIRFTL